MRHDLYAILIVVKNCAVCSLKAFFAQTHRSKTMNILVIFAHPYNKSLNYAIYQRTLAALEKNGHDVITHDLYAENFDPVLKGYEAASDGPPKDEAIKTHAKHLTWADGIVVIHPTWWGQMPAILKGWVDRVIKNGIAFTFREDENGSKKRVRLVRIKKSLVINTANSSVKREESLGNPLQNLWEKSVFSFLKVKDFHRKVFQIVSESTYEQRVLWLDETEAFINKHFPKER